MYLDFRLHHMCNVTNQTLPIRLKVRNSVNIKGVKKKD